jgi:tripartite-type tricarboxylate transporter receptor subunit TctC
MLRPIIACLAVAVACASAPASAQSAYPAKPLRFIVPFPPGGATDIITRVIAQKLAEQVGQPVVVENRPGAGGAIGSELVARAAPDGYTLLMATTSTHSIGPTLNPKTPYSVERDFAPVCEVATSTNVLVVSPALGIGSVKELIAAAKSKPGQLNFASSGTGTIVHLSGELFRSMAGIDVVHVPYKGTALALPDLMSGQVAMIFDNIVSAMPNIKSGKVKPLAVTARRRSALLPDLPTVIEAGVAEFTSDAYFAVFVPAATPREVVERLNRELVRAVANPEVREQLARQGAEPVGGTPAELAATVKAETEKWARVIRQANIKLE